MMIKKKELLRFALYVLVVVLLNIAASSTFFRTDLSSDGKYSLTDVSRDIVQELGEPLTVKIYISENLPYPYNNLEQNIRDILAEYSIAGNKNFNYDIYRIKASDDGGPSETAEIESDARSYGINPVQIKRVDNSEIKLVSAYMGAAFIHADMVETIPVINPNQNIEYLITSTINGIQQKTSRLLALESNIEMKLYLSSSLFPVSDELRTYPENLEAVVKSLNKINYGRIDFKWYDTDKDPAAAAEAASYGFTPLSIQNEDGSSDEAWASAVLAFSDNYTSFDVFNQTIFGYSIQPAAELEEPLNGVIERLIGVGNKVAWLTDHGTIQLRSGAQQTIEPTAGIFGGLASERYNLQTVSLEKGVIPKDAGSLIIARPQPLSQFTDWELYQIDQFLMKGGNVAVFTDGFMEYIPQNNNQFQQQAPIYIPRNTGLEKLLEFYGVSVEKAFVMDQKCFNQQQQTAGGIVETPLYFAPEIQPDKINSDIPYLSGIKGLIMLNNSPVRIAGDLPEGRRGRVLYSSSDKSWLADDPQNINLYNPQMIFPPNEAEMESYPLAAVLEGSFTSYFADKGVPQRPEDPEQDPAETVDEQVLFGINELSKQENFVPSTESGKIFVFGSSFVPTDNLLDQNGTSTNTVMILNVLDDLNGRGDYALMRRKGLSFNPLDDTPSAVRTFVKTLNIALIPLLVVLAGIIVWLRWIRRQKRIAAMFTEEADD